MKNVMRVLSVAALSATFTLPTLAQTPTATPAAAAPAAAPAQDVCSEPARTELYTKYYEEKKTNQATAYETGKTYLQKYASCTDEYTAAVKKFVDAYGVASVRLNALKAYEAKDWNTLYKVGGESLAIKPDDVQLLTILGFSSLEANKAGNTTHNAAALDYSKKAIQMIEAGQVPEKWAPFKDKNEALAYLYYTVGALNAKDAPAEASKALITAAKFEVPQVKNAPATYELLAGTYAEQYKNSLAALKPFDGQPETPESKLAFDNFYGVLDRLIDAYARAVAVETDAKKKEEHRNTLTVLYKQRNKESVEGLDTLVAGVLSKPVPEPFVPGTTPAPAATPTTATTPPAATGTTVGGTTNTTTPAPAKPVTTPTPPPATTKTEPAKPVASPTPTPAPTPTKTRKP
ncbi:hypothetical protein BH18ACI2_BH18ACI2_18340 [soil metagenome]